MLKAKQQSAVVVDRLVSDVGRDMPPLDIRLLFLLGYLFSLVLEGPLRMLLSLVKLETLLYMRDMVAFCTVLYISFKGYPGKKYSLNVTAIVLFVMVCHLLIGFWVGHPAFSLLFGFKIFLSFMFGVSCADLLLEWDAWILKFSMLVLAVTAFGVYLNYVIGQFPWEGGEFETAFGVAKNSTIWWAGGERRLPGFARMNFSAAMIIGITAAFVVFEARSYWVKLFALAMAISAIYLTTSKGVLMALGVASLCGLLPNGETRKKATVFFFWLFVIAAIMAPPISYLVGVSPNSMRFAPSFLVSFIDRASTTWPNSLNDLSSWYTVLLGQGVGGVGGSLRYGAEFYRYSPIDNIALYCYCTFGVLGLVYFVASARQIYSLLNARTDFGLSLLGVGVVILGNGVTAHQFEDAFVGIVMGLMVGAVPRSGLHWVSSRKSIAGFVG